MACLYVVCQNCNRLKILSVDAWEINVKEFSTIVLFLLGSVMKNNKSCHKLTSTGLNSFGSFSVAFNINCLIFFLF